MDILQRTERLLSDTEKSLADLAHEAGAARNYDLAASLIELARRIKDLGEQVANRNSKTGHTSTADQTSAGQSLKGGSTPVQRRGRLGQYPRFLREGENLVKIGWSKSEKTEYEHKSPKRVLAVLCETLDNANGKRVAMNKVLPLRDPADGSAIPHYQPYVCLAWLRSVGLVIQHGRQGYSLAKGTDLEKSVEMNWASLPTR